MINKKLINPKTIAVIGGSDNINSPGGRLIDNLLKHNYKGKLYVVNPKKNKIKDLQVYKDVSLLPNNIDLAIIAISSKFVEQAVKVLTEQKNTQAFIIISAGFSDTGNEEKALEKRIVKQIEKHGGSLLGPNNIGLINTHYAGAFTTPVPSLNKNGVDLISGSGATAVFIVEAAVKQGLQFNSIWTVGNSAQIGVEEVLEYLDENFDENSPKIKLLYIESINNPNKLLKHSRSLIEKGAKIVAIKSGSSQAGNRAASSHTGALASPDVAVQALFEKAGIIRVFGRNEMIQVAGVLQYGLPKGKNILIVTHAGGPGVMLTDVLEKNGMKVPELKNPKAKELLQYLFPGSSIANPIDFLATGTAEQLDIILKYAQNFDEIDAIAVIFGSPGLFKVFDVYEALDKHINNSEKPIYPILPSLINVKEEIDFFHKKDKMSFPYEVLFGKALTKAYYSPKIFPIEYNKNKKKTTLKTDNKNGYLSPEKANKILSEFDFPLVQEQVFTEVDKALSYAKKLYPVVLKVVGIIHKSDADGVKLNIENDKDFIENFNRILQIKGAKAVLVQEQKHGLELFTGVKYEDKFGHLLMFGLGGIYIEILHDVQSILSPVNKDEIRSKIQQLKGYSLLKGIRGQKGIDIEKFIDLISKLDKLIQTYPEIKELDINPVLATENELIIVDYRIKI